MWPRWIGVGIRAGNVTACPSRFSHPFLFILYVGLTGWQIVVTAENPAQDETHETMSGA